MSIIIIIIIIIIIVKILLSRSLVTLCMSFHVSPLVPPRLYIPRIKFYQNIPQMRHQAIPTVLQMNAWTQLTYKPCFHNFSNLILPDPKYTAA